MDTTIVTPKPLFTSMNFATTTPSGPDAPDAAGGVLWAIGRLQEAIDDTSRATTLLSEKLSPVLSDESHPVSQQPVRQSIGPPNCEVASAILHLASRVVDLEYRTRDIILRLAL